MPACPPASCCRPYIIDLESTNGTSLNGDKIEHSRYIELMEKDVLKFGDSTREYVLLHTDSGQ
jgi:smad nuclear-interacting protein 1